MDSQEGKMNRFKRCLIAAAAAGLAVMMVAGCGGGSGKADSAASGTSSINIVQVKSEKEADLVDQAKKEGVVKVYSITSRAAKAGADFEKKYGIKVEASDMKDFELIDKVTTEVKGNADGADVVICQDSGRVYGELLASGYLENYIPAATIMPSPARKKQNIKPRRVYTVLLDPLNSFQTNTPQMAATIGAP